jgi:putative transposase
VQPDQTAATRQDPIRPLEHHNLRGGASKRPHRGTWLLDRPINGDHFLVYIEKVLLPTLRLGDVVIVDNLQSHSRRGVREALRRAGAKLLFLPKYSPDLNPIEQAFAKLKHQLRKAAARTKDTICEAIGALLDSVTVQECANYFKHSAYGSA